MQNKLRLACGMLAVHLDLNRPDELVPGPPVHCVEILQIIQIIKFF